MMRPRKTIFFFLLTVHSTLIGTLLSSLLASPAFARTLLTHSPVEERENTPIPRENQPIEPCGSQDETDFGYCLKKFCEEPYETVCGTIDWEKQRRGEKLDRFRQTVTKKALKAAATAIDWEHPNSFTDDDLMALTGKKKRQAVAAYVETEFKTINEKLKDAKDSIKSRVSFMKKNLDESLRAAAKFPSETPEQRTQAEKARTVLQSVQLTFASDIFDDPDFTNGENEETKDALIKDFFETCGEDGLEDNAFASTYGNVPRIILCPGAMIATAEHNDPGLEKGEKYMVGLLMTLAHEVAHHFDATSFPKIYEKFKACISEHGRQTLGQPESLDPYMDEITADYWGIEAVVQYMKARAPTDHKKYVVLRRVVEDLCGTADDKTHPSGRWRIENIVRKNPELHHALGCKIPEASGGAPSCTLNGPTKKTLWNPTH